MRLLLATSELQPYSKSGGLADMVGALAKAFARGGHQVGVVTPLYRGIQERFPEIRPFDWHMRLPLGMGQVEAGVRVAQPAPNLTVYFVDQPRFFDRSGLYHEGGWDYADNAERFTFFSKSVAHLARYLDWKPQWIHAHDWQTGLVPLLIRHQALADGWRLAPPTCLTIHNVAYQGHYPESAYQFANLPDSYFNPKGVEYYGGVNFLKAGIVYADLITTVSPRYAREITTPEFAYGLDGALRARQEDLVGILNGVDYDDWNTTRNRHLTHFYSARSMAGKAKGKRALQEEMGLTPDSGVPLFGTVTRLTDQKGVDILIGALEEMLAARMQFVMLGSGDRAFEVAYAELARRHPGKAAVRVGYDEGLAHRIQAGSDFYLMPSKFEPCGLTQLYSLRYGTIPIVRVTGGLDDTVVDAAEDVAGADGIKFGQYSVRALARAMRKALVLYDAPDAFRHYRRNGMKQDFSWDLTTARLIELFQRKV